MSAREPEAVVRPSPRVVFLDLLRLVASVQMIQGHSIDGVLAAGLRHGLVYDAWIFARGLTATSFLVAAGLAFHATVVAGPAGSQGPDARRRRLRRAGMLVSLGYLLHLPLGAILDPGASGAHAAWAAFAICDVLQCIGLTLGALELVAPRLRRPWPLALGVAVTAYAVAPLTARVDPAGPLRVLENLVTRSGGSLFPLTPYAGHLCAGIALGAFVLPRGAFTPRRTTTWRLALAGGLTVALAALLFALLPGGDPAVSPAWTVMKVGLVTLLAAALAAASLGVDRLPRFFETLAGETLLLYTSHLLAIYGAGVGLAAVVGPTLPLGPAVVVAVLAIAGSAAFAFGWRWARARLAPRRPRG